MKTTTYDTLKLIYDMPAVNWEQNALPVGNGYLGASIMGGIQEESICLNEKTLWTGGPSLARKDYNGGNLTNKAFTLMQVQKALKAGEVNKVATYMEQLVGDRHGFGAYQTLGNIRFSFDGIDEKKVHKYQRYLDLNQSIFNVQFQHNGTEYTREIFANYPNRVIVMRFQTKGKHKLSFYAYYDTDTLQKNAKIETSNHDLIYYGELEDNQMRYEATLHFILNNGDIIMDKQSVQIVDSSDVIILFTAATDYCNIYPTYRSSKNPHSITEEILYHAKSKSYDTLLSEHIQDYQHLFHRVSVNFGGVYPDCCTDQLRKEYIENIDSNCFHNNRYLEELYYQYGRYLLISSSRFGSLPANLQGVWNDSNHPAWGGDYHINVNLQMNYWPATVTNLKETMIPFVEYVDSLREPGRVTAKEYYGIISDEQHPQNGWVAHTQSTPFGWTCPGWEYSWGWSSAAAAWLNQNLWDYYQFFIDDSDLQNKIYPIMRESVLFYMQYLTYDEKQKRMVSSPTYSPEHGPVTIGNTYEQSLIQELLMNFATAAKCLGKDKELMEQATIVATKMNPYHISKHSGMIMEWYEEDDDNFDNRCVEKNHRHTSHLLGLYPGHSINPTTPTLLEAAKKSLNDRGDESNGWARAMKVCLWSRIGDGNRCYQILRGLLEDSTYDNLWDTCPPFQIDGNFGGTAGMSEMLIQSHMGYIQLLPALPDVWKDGSFSGLCARGGFEVQAAWQNKILTQLSVLSLAGKKCKIQIKNCKVVDSDNCDISCTYKNGILSFPTHRNEKYIIEVH